MTEKNRQWLLASRPQGMVSEENFELVESPMPQPDLAADEILIKNVYISLDPAMRGWMDDAPSYLPPVAIGSPMRASSMAEVVASENPEYPVGAHVQGMFGWQEYCIANSSTDLFKPRLVPEGVPLTMPLSIMGGTGFTAYFGLLRVGEPQAGETVVVSGAAGATGSAAAQIAKIKGCRVIGIAGGEEKCEWLLEQAGLDACIDYKNENVETRLSELCPDGINVFFDNVGGDILQACLANMAQFGRIIMCGAIANYNDDEPRPGPTNMNNIITRRLKMQGFIMFDYVDEMEQAAVDLATWVGEGKLVWQEDVQEGFEKLPATLLRLYQGLNHGKQLLKV
jgi:NADPH-dependent curcumin reductase CurA